MLNPEVLQDSLSLVIDDEQKLMLDFYDRLFAEHPEVRPMFGTDLRPQATMLQEAIGAVLDHLDDAEWLGRTLGALGRRHNDLGVTPEMYGWVADALVTTMAEHGGGAWTGEMTAAWNDALGAVAGLMLDAYPAVAD
ncbi:globin domain-containing protein [Gordonia hongkongensis]|uniref:globin domain-containing protein n=1 Tax=Gordonia hongkongensis TaxID=1701090 RepID=UPI001FF80B39|nr:globin domain-containing protein [Gordonia hongkongensis]UPG67851.1 globin domain-containing protein [Gordonia hongkongensis]